MYVREDITIDILKKNGYAIKSSLSNFVQEYLNTKYDFIPFPKDKGVPTNSIIPSDFSALMYMFHCLIKIECMELDHTCFYIENKPKKDIIRVPQDTGYDVILKGVNTDIHFVKSPSFMINGIVHPETFDTKTVYLKLVYYLLNNNNYPVNIDSVLPFGETIKTSFLEYIKKGMPFEKIINKLILSQFPTFDEYMKSINKYIFYSNSVEFSPSQIKNKKIDTDIVFKSQVFNSMLTSVKSFNNNDYDNKLLSAYRKRVFDSLDNISFILENNLYAYPYLNNDLVYPYNKDIKHDKLQNDSRICFNAEIYVQVLNRVTSSKDAEDILKNTYIVKRAYYSVLKAYFFSYHMGFNEKYGHLYNIKDALIKPPNVILDDIKIGEYKDDIYYPVWTLNQINSIKDKSTLFNLIIKTVWYNNKFMLKQLETPLKNLLRENKNDMYIFNKLNELYKRFKPKDTGFNKGQFRYNEIEKMGVFNKLPSVKEIKYLDFGGGIGDVGASIAKNRGFEKKNSFVSDIQNWLGKDNTDEFVKYITYRYLKTNDLPFQNEEFHFITCLQVLHHIPDKEYTISQLYRILNKDGILLIREHNCESIQDRMLIDLEHTLHAFVVDEQGQDYLQNYNDNYMSKKELDTLMTRAGFQKITTGITFPEDKGITKYYYSMWKKEQVKKSWADMMDEEEEEKHLKLEPSNSNIVKFDKCYVWLLMKGDNYTPGVYTSVHSINRTKSCKDNKINTVVMVTNDVSENAINELKKVCDYIVRVDYINHPTKELKTERQRELYSSWIDASYTKWQMLRLPFDKAIFLDSDIIILDNIDHLFNLKAPAGHFSSPFAYPAGKLINYYVNNNIAGDDGYAKQGSTITKSMINKAMLNDRVDKRTTTVAATSILLEPNIRDYDNYINMLNTEFKDEFGFDVNSGADEQSISYYYSLYDKGPKKDWTNIHQRYNFLSWKTHKFLNNEMPYVIHFLSQPKPWKLQVDKYSDLVNWYIMFLDGLKGDTSFFKDVINNVSKDTDDISKLKEVCLNMDQKYIRSLSTKFKNIDSCLDIVCRIQKK